MAAIEASAVRCQTMADGTLRLVVDIEPRHAQAAFRLFGSPGTAVALAALKATYTEPTVDRPKGGEIAKWLGIRCGEPSFRDWLGRTFPHQWGVAIGKTDAERAASVIRAVCSVESRAEFDNDTEAAERFHRLIRGPFSKHMIATGATA